MPRQNDIAERPDHRCFILPGDRRCARSTFAKVGSRSTVIEYHGDSVAPMDLPDERRTVRGTHVRVVLSDTTSEPVASVQLAHHCGLPVRAGAAVTDAHVPDAQAAAESLRGFAGAMRAASDFIVKAAGILSSFNALSLEKFVLDDEALTAQRALDESLSVGRADLAEDVVSAVEPGGSYLAAGAADARRAAADEVARRLETFTPPDDLDPLVRRQLDEPCLS